MALHVNETEPERRRGALAELAALANYWERRCKRAESVRRRSRARFAAFCVAVYLTGAAGGWGVAEHQQASLAR